MNCKEAEKLIPSFLIRQLNKRELNQFLLHVEECPDCMEELTIQYLVMIGSSLIEEGKSFNLRKSLNELLLEAKKQVKNQTASLPALKSLQTYREHISACLG